MKTFIDGGSGVAGDMLLGALVGLGLSPKELSATLSAAIPLKGWSLRIRPVERTMWPSWSIRVVHDRPFTSPEKMLSFIKGSKLPAPVKKSALAILKSLQRAEAQAHGHTHAHFDPQGLGRIDTLVDVIGNAWGFWRLGLKDVRASALNTGRIAPATRALLSSAKVPVYADTHKHELATPTGVAILTHFVDEFVTMPLLMLQKAGYGAGTLKREGKPNVLAIYQGNSGRKLLKYTPFNYATNT